MKSSSKLKIALIGDQNPAVKAHVAIPKALRLAGDSIGGTIEATWIHTDQLYGNAANRLRDFQGIWCVPASPYVSMEGALNAIRFAREDKVPFLGTCGGSQHALIEYCRNVLGLTNADHAESNPDAMFALIAPLPCALRETESRIRLVDGSRLRSIYGCAEVTEPFNCGFGLNPKHHEIFESTKLRISGFGEDGIARAVELDDHPFFIATLFQPERSAFNNISHPLVVAFLKAAAS